LKIALLLAVVLTTGFAFGQSQEYNGIVKVKGENLPLPGVNVIVKDTKIVTQTDFDGNFTISVPDSLKVLQFSFLGMITLTYKLSEEKNLEIFLKEDCNIDWFDEQHLGFYLNSGLINNSVGGQFHLSFTPHYSFPTIKTGISYQTNLKENRFLNTYLNFHHLFVSCYFNADINSSYRNLDYENDIDLSAYSVETSLNFHRISTIIGFSSIEFNKTSTNKSINSVGPTFGLGTWIGPPFLISVSAKTTIYKNLSEYHVDIRRQYKGFYTFLKYYKVNEFNELSLGIGIEFYY